ncbi:MAG: VWA domain-containing protein [Terracidiphilus sp.]|nr:VWA domain-containing protein [Terracidiphilus sp.]MDR3777359.1 VWA domain-containing protein [Terracidiphilus sp.]
MRWGVAALLLGLPALSVTGWAQLAPSPDAPPVSTAPGPSPEEESVATFKVNVNLVNVFFTVKGKDGALIPHLSKDDCTVSEDKEPQKIKNFVAETKQPLTLGILLDTSGSQMRVLPLEQDAGSQFLQRVIKPKDEAFILSVDVNVDLLQDLTNSTRLLTRALNKAEINAGVGFGSGPVPTAGGPRGTLLYDAVYLASNEKLTSETGRKALILLTDGEDQGSRNKLNEAIAAAQKSNAIVYVILIADVQGYLDQGVGYFGYSPMKKMADETGGRVINVGNNGKKLEAAFEQIEEELRTQYVASYTPSNTKLDGTYRKLSVECRGDGLKVQARKGYFAPLP